MTNTAVQGGYFDGQSAMERPVAVEFLVQGLAFQNPAPDSRGALVLWHYDDLRLVSLQRDNGHITLGWTGNDAVRLRLKNQQAGEQLFELAPHLKAQRPERGILKPVMVSAAILLVFVGLYFAYPVARQAIIMAMPYNWVESMGDTMGMGLVRSAGVCTESAGVDALATMTARLTEDTVMPYDLEIRVVNMPMVNAFAAPGGKVIIARGLLDEAKSADEVAGVLGHELGHVKHRHPLERMIDVYGFELVLGSMGGNLGSYGGLMLLMKFSRDDEREADHTGLELLREAHIANTGFADFFKRLEEKHGSMPGAMQFLSTHPQPEEREQAIRNAEQDKETTPALSSQDWRALQSICDEVDNGPIDDVNDDDVEIIQI